MWKVKFSSGTCSSKLTSGVCSNNLTVSSNHNSFSPTCSMIDRPFEEKVVEANGHAQVANSVEIPSQQFPESQSMVSDAKESSARASLANNSRDECRREIQGVGLTNLVETSIASNEDAECVSSTSDLFHSVDWIGNVLKVADEKQYYQSCRCNGFIYNVQEYAIIRFEDERLVPSKLRGALAQQQELLPHVTGRSQVQVVETTSGRNASTIFPEEQWRMFKWMSMTVFTSKFMSLVVLLAYRHSFDLCLDVHVEKPFSGSFRAMWEDVKAGKKWVTVNRCYFPRDLPHAVGRPCSLESNEVYLSNCSSTVMAGQIQGPCEVLPPSKFNEERERRSRLETRPNCGLRPLYICKWIYDESKGLFRDVSC
ncbi:hypothetical protein K7X08_005390 [Anisodus acutangulus]|uniref:BAH domain-containing protein n=1 Tax=Anisodus acutangulus TaxID=402998 RepID=A0A9Q1R6B2_9SOLA|nr:hypothetical protein K7X08_005390 [Anisodus acutangulus]